jgi:hypothetical protein
MSWITLLKIYKNIITIQKKNDNNITMSIPIRLGKSRYTSDDLYVRKGFMNNKSAIKQKINTTPLRAKRGTETADLANMRPGFKRSNPRVYVPDFDTQPQGQQQIHLSDSSVSQLQGISQSVQKMERLISSPATMTPEGFQIATLQIGKLDYAERLELNQIILKKGDETSDKIIERLNRVVPLPVSPAVAAKPTARGLTAKDMELKYVDDAKQPDINRRDGVYQNTPSAVKMLEDVKKKGAAKLSDLNFNQYLMDSLQAAQANPEDFKSGKDEKKARKAKFDQDVATEMKEYERRALQTIKKGTSPAKTRQIKGSQTYIPVETLRKEAKDLGYKAKSTDRSTLINYIKANDPNYEKRFYTKTPAPAKKKRQRGTGKSKISKKYM